MVLFEAGLVLRSYLQFFTTWAPRWMQVMKDVVYLDFSKAFDSVAHEKLLHKLSLLGIQGSLHAWFTDYLNSRYQQVVIDGMFSS
jgi:ABC-type proline/glycine betaine transport system substrate-binding protein